MRRIVLIAHNLRSSHNVGALLRTAEGLGIEAIYLTGYTPYPKLKDDPRLPHLSKKIDAQIQKTALGAEKFVNIFHYDSIFDIMKELKNKDYKLVAIEQATDSVLFPDYIPPPKIALIVGREVEGLEADVLKNVDQVVEIPMLGKKESYNVAQAAAIAMYHCRFIS